MALNINRPLQARGLGTVALCTPDGDPKLGVRSDASLLVATKKDSANPPLTHTTPSGTVLVQPGVGLSVTVLNPLAKQASTRVLACVQGATTNPCSVTTCEVTADGTFTIGLNTDPGGAGAYVFYMLFN